MLHEPVLYTGGLPHSTRNYTPFNSRMASTIRRETARGSAGNKRRTLTCRKRKRYNVIRRRTLDTDQWSSRLNNILINVFFPLPFAGETGQREWCTLAYWELGGRVGRLYPVEPATVNVFDSLHDGDGLCLATLAENHNAPPAVQRTRSKIGLGKSPEIYPWNVLILFLKNFPQSHERY